MVVTIGSTQTRQTKGVVKCFYLHNGSKNVQPARKHKSPISWKTPSFFRGGQGAQSTRAAACKILQSKKEF